MKLRTLLFAAILSLFFVSSQAQASSLPTYTGADVNLSTLSMNDEGFIRNDVPSVNGYLNKVTGLIPAHSQILFTYNVTGGMSLGTVLVDYANYDYKWSDGRHTGSASASTNGTPYAVGYIDGAPSTPLVLASAGLTDSNHGFTLIQNFSDGLADFTSLITGLMIGDGLVEAHFIVSAVPLPAALPLLGLGLAGLVGLRARKKAAKTA